MNIITLIKIGWRNIWRNKKRSLVVILSIVLGLYGGLIISSLMITLNSQRMDTAINTYLADIQIHDKEFSKEYSLSDTISNIQYLEKNLKQDNRVKAYSKRVVINGMLSNSTGSYGVNVLGINPETEMKVTNVYTKIVEGDYFESERSNTMVVGKKLAEKLNLKLRSKVVIAFQNVNGDITSLLFRIEGIFKSGNGMFDDYNVFVKNSSIFSNIPDLKSYHEIPILTGRVVPQLSPHCHTTGSASRVVPLGSPPGAPSGATPLPDCAKGCHMLSNTKESTQKYPSHNNMTTFRTD